MGTHKQLGKQAEKKYPRGHQSPTEVGLPPQACVPEGKIFLVVTAGFRDKIACIGSVSLGLEAPAFMEAATDTYIFQSHH